MKKLTGLLCCFSLLLAACHKQEEAAPAPTKVSAVKVIQEDLPWNIEYPAQVAGSLEIQIRAQVGGILESRLYNEGEFVKEGTQLFQIDDSEYKVALEKAQGSLAQAQAEERRTQRTYQRIKTLRQSNAVSQQDYDNALSAYETAKANVKVAQAAVEGAQINLGYTKVTAPISGIVGQAVPSVGSLISPLGESGYLTNMVQIDPLYVKFSMPGSQFAKLSDGFLSGQIAVGNMQPGHKEAAQEYRDKDVNDVAVYVEAVLSNGTVYPQRGKIIFFDSSENAQTSSIAMKAEFANPTDSRLLMPGQFVRVHLVGATYKNAILIPSSAVLHSTNGLSVYVVNDSQTVEARPIEADLQDDVYIVTKGLKAGEIIISEGLSRVRPDQKVEASVQPFEVKVDAGKIAPANTQSQANAQQQEPLEQTIAETEVPAAPASSEADSNGAQSGASN